MNTSTRDGRTSWTFWGISSFYALCRPPRPSRIPGGERYAGLRWIPTSTASPRPRTSTKTTCATGASSGPSAGTVMRRYDVIVAAQHVVLLEHEGPVCDLPKALEELKERLSAMDVTSHRT